MNGDEYKKVIDQLGLSQVESARFLGVDSSTVRRWISNKIRVPIAVIKLMRTMVTRSISASEVDNASRKQIR